jgi:hypothetical protein
VAEHLGRLVRWPLPDHAGRRHKADGGVVVGGQQPGDRDQGVVRPDEGGQRVGGDSAGEQDDDLPALPVDAERLGRLVEPVGVEVAQQRVDRRGPRPGRTAHGVADASHCGHVAAGEDRLGLRPGRGAGGAVGGPGGAGERAAARSTRAWMSRTNRSTLAGSSASDRSP